MNTQTETLQSVESPQPYADRPYERTLASAGRKFVSLDLDEDLVKRIDDLRGGSRRGLQIDALLRRALSMEMEMEPAMS
jgi:hypothetical protein